VEELRLQVVLDKNLGSEIDGVVAFGDFRPKEGATFYAIYNVDEAHLFYRDLIMGRSLPMVLVARNLETMGVFVAVTLFLQRDLAVHPAVPGLFSAVNLMDSYGRSGLAHVDRDLSRFLRFLRGYLSENKGLVQDALATAVGFLRAYILDGVTPSMQAEPEPPRIIDRGTDGFVFATSHHTDLLSGWEELYRQGFLRGLLIHQEGDRCHVLAARKSPYLSLDLKKAAAILNEAESAMGEPAEWVTDGFWLRGPEGGTLILPSALLQVFLRV
jgi:hypothetical protein